MNLYTKSAKFLLNVKLLSLKKNIKLQKLAFLVFIMITNIRE